jgi:aminopeptidase-like protein
MAVLVETFAGLLSAIYFNSRNRVKKNTPNLAPKGEVPHTREGLYQWLSQMKKCGYSLARLLTWTNVAVGYIVNVSNPIAAVWCLGRFRFAAE